MIFGTGVPINLLLDEARAGRAENIAGAVRAMEDLGFDFVAVGDHIVHSGISGYGRPEGQGAAIYGDPFSMLAYIAATSKKIRLITSVLVLPYRQPFHTAHALATIDVLSRGRLIFGVGAGYARHEFVAFGIPLKERGPMSDEYLKIITALWTQDSVTFNGRYYSFSNVSLLVRPVQRPRPPIWVAGASGRSLRRAVELGDGWYPLGFAYPRVGSKEIRTEVTPGELQEETRRANDWRRSLGMPPLEVVVHFGPGVKFNDEPAKPARSRQDLYGQCFPGRGTEEEVIAHLKAYQEAGATGFAARFFGVTLAECLSDMERFASRVMPAFRG